jgi:sugar lactone lactonase YvrE
VRTDWIPGLTLLTLVAGCVAESPLVWEGGLPGECADGTDNDADGDFDCDDRDCDGAPDCDDSGPVFNCATVPDRPTSETWVSGARGFHGLAFDDAGFLIGSDNNALLRTDREGNSTVFVPGLGMLQQMTYLPDGDLIVSSGETGGLYRVTPEGGVETIAADLHAYSVLLGPDGRIYSGTTVGPTNPGIARTNLETGEVEEFARLPEGVGARSLNFNRDFTALYVGIGGGLGTGTIFRIELDEDLEPIADPEVFAQGVGQGWLDAIAVDACGRLYVPDSWTLGLYRVDPSGEVEHYLDWAHSEGLYGHDAVFGSGIGGWLDDALYMPLPYQANKVKELVIGVPGRTYPGAVINASQ